MTCLECNSIIAVNRKYCSNTCRSRFYCKNTQYNQEYKKRKKREWYLKNRDTELIKIKTYQAAHKETLAIAHNNYIKKRKQADPSFKIACNLRSRLNRLIKNKKVGSAITDLGCSIEDLKTHLESKFQPGMTWQNHGIKGWHIDHIKPLYDFDLTDKVQFLEACHYTNLQPLWWYDNLSKGVN